MRTGMIIALLGFCAALSAAEAPRIAFPAALDAAAIEQDRLDDVMENSLILGNGDVNGLLYMRGGQLVLKLTKNDVWDARIDTSKDPPLLKIDVKNKKLIGRPHGPMPSWNKPYPCPRPCAYVVFGATTGATASWQPIRAQGRVNSFRLEGDTAVMRIQGRPGASNGYRCAPLDLSTDKYSSLRVKISGSPNAKYYVDVMDAAGRVILSSKWIATPAKPQEKVFALPPGRRVGCLILYTWTVDGKAAENRFASVVFEGTGGKQAVDFTTVGKATPCRSVLDIRRAAATAGAEDGPTAVRALAQKNVFLIDSATPAALEPIFATYLPKAKAGRQGAAQWITQQLPGDPDWPGMTFAVALCGKGGRKAVAVVTSLESKDPLADAVALAKTALAADAAKLIGEHERAWRAFWSASGVDLDDAELRNMWYRNLYFLRCVSKPGVEAIGLYASLTNDSPPWHGSHTLNYNSEQTFWSAYVTNHVELAEPYEQMIFRYLPRARWFARQTYNCGGAHIPHNIFTHEVPDPQKCRSKNNRMHAFPPYAHTIGVSGFVVQNLWWRYKYQPDRKYLESTAYPAVRDVAVFFADFMDQCETGAAGKVILAPSYSPEHWSLTPDFKYNRNGTFDIAFAQFIFKAAIEAAGVLGKDAPLAARFGKALDRLPPYPLSEGDEPIVVDVQDAPPINYNIAVPVVPVFPAEQITVFSGEAEKKLFLRTVRRVKWNGYNSSMILSIARARLSIPGTWQWIKRELLARSRPNGTITLRRGDRCGHFTEQFAATAAVSEMLLQSVGGILRVFPAWPADKPASFVNLRAQGGFLVSAQQAEGRITRLEIVSTVGGRLRMVSPGPTANITRSGGGQPVTLKADARGIIELDTKPGERLRIAAARH